MKGPEHGYGAEINRGTFLYQSNNCYSETDLAKFSFSEIENAFMYVCSVMYGMNTAVVCKDAEKILYRQDLRTAYLIMWLGRKVTI